MQPSLQALYAQVDRLNEKIALIKKYEPGFASVHHNDEHSRVVQALAMRTASSLITTANNATKLSQIMEVTFKE